MGRTPRQTHRLMGMGGSNGAPDEVVRAAPSMESNVSYERDEATLIRGADGQDPVDREQRLLKERDEATSIRGADGQDHSVLLEQAIETEHKR